MFHVLPFASRFIVLLVSISTASCTGRPKTLSRAILESTRCTTLSPGKTRSFWVGTVISDRVRLWHIHVKRHLWRFSLKVSRGWLIDGLSLSIHIDLCEYRKWATLKWDAYNEMYSNNYYNVCICLTAV